MLILYYLLYAQLKLHLDKCTATLRRMMFQRGEGWQAGYQLSGHFIPHLKQIRQNNYSLLILVVDTGKV